MMVFHRRSKRVKIFSKTFVTKYLYKRDSNASKRTCILIDIIHKYLKEKTRKKKRKWSVLSYYRLSPADKSLWFDVQVNEIYVKFRFTGSGFWAPDGQNDMKWVFTNFNKKNSTLFGKTNHSMFDYSLRVIDELKMSEIRILNLCHKKSILVDIYRQSLLSNDDGHVNSKSFNSHCPQWNILVAVDIIVVSLERTDRLSISAFFSQLLWKTWQTFKSCVSCQRRN